jgi:zinc protease
MPINSIASASINLSAVPRVPPVAAIPRPQDVRNPVGHRSSAHARTGQPSSPECPTVEVPLIGVKKDVLDDLAQMLDGRALTDRELATLISGDFGRTPMGEAMVRPLVADALRACLTQASTSDRETWEAVVEDAVRLPLRSWHALHADPSPELVQPHQSATLQVLFQLLHEPLPADARWEDAFPARQEVSARIRTLERVAREATPHQSAPVPVGSGNPWTAVALGLLALGALPAARADAAAGEGDHGADDAWRAQAPLLSRSLANVAAPAAGLLARAGSAMVRYPRAMLATLGGAALVGAATALYQSLGIPVPDGAASQQGGFGPLAGALAPDVMALLVDQVRHADATLPADERAMQAVRALGPAAEGARALWSMARDGRSDRLQFIASEPDIAFGGWLINQVLGEPVPAGGADMTWSDFTLSNGLRVILTPGKGDEVGVQLRFGDGSAIECEGQRGAVHLAEHLWFRRNIPGQVPFDELYAAAGVNDNAYTTHDTTVYFTEGPADALPLILLEKGYRLAHATDSLSPVHFEAERNVVLNELRQRDTTANRAAEVLARAMYPYGHPYHAYVGGRPRDLRALEASDLESLMRARQRPNLATLVVSGNVDEFNVRRLVTDYFADIQPGNTFARRVPDVQRRYVDSNEEIFDEVSTPKLYRAWNVPQDGHADLPLLTLAARILSRRLADALENEVMFAAAYVDPREIGSQLKILIDVRGDADQQHVEDTLNRVLASFLELGPTQAELESGRNYLIEAGARAQASSDAMATAVLHCVDRHAAPDCANDEVKAWHEATPGSVKKVAAEWISQGAHTLLVTPGERARQSPEVAGEPLHVPWASGSADPGLFATPTHVDRTVLPPMAEPAAPYFPDVSRTALSNGLPLVLAPMREGRNARVVFVFDGGRIGDLDPDIGMGVARAALRVLTQRAGTLEGEALALKLDSLRLTVAARSMEGYSTVVLQGPPANLGQGIQLVNDMISDTRFPQYMLDRSHAAARANMNLIATEAALRGNVLIETLVLGERHPYGQDPLGEGNEASLAAMKPSQLALWAKRYLDPSNATIVAVGPFDSDTLARDMAQNFGSVDGATERSRAEIPLVGQSGHPGVHVLPMGQGRQSHVMLGYPVVSDGSLNDILPMCIDKIIQHRVKKTLREQQGLTYGVYPLATGTRGVRVCGFRSAVAPAYGIDALAIARKVVSDLLEGRDPVTQAELSLYVGGYLRELAAQFHEPWNVESALVTAVDVGNHTPVDQAAQTMRKLTSDEVNAALERMSADELTWILAGPPILGAERSGSSGTSDEESEMAEMRLRFTAMGLSQFTTVDPVTGDRTVHPL